MKKIYLGHMQRESCDAFKFSREKGVIVNSVLLVNVIQVEKYI